MRKILELIQKSISNRFFLIVILPFLINFEFIGCSSNETKQVKNTIRDSVGVKIIENWAPIWDEEDQWKLSEKPVLEIADENFFRVRGAILFSDGRIVVANSGASELRFYNKNGKFTKTVGGKGGGPGEFSNFMVALHKISQDSFQVFDTMTLRMSVFDSNGILKRDFYLEPAGKYPIMDVQTFLDGSLFVSTSWSSALDMGDHETGIKRHPTPLLHYSQQGVLMDTFAILPGPEYYMFVEGDRYAFIGNFPFKHNLVSSIFSNRAFMGSSDKFEILVYSFNGDLQKIITLPGIDLTLTDKEFKETIQSQLNRIDDLESKKRYTKYWSKLPHRKSKPAYSNLVIDDEGNLWIEEYQYDESKLTTWWIFNLEGFLLVEIEMSGNFQVFEIGHEYVLGKKINEDGFESIHVYRLKKSYFIMEEK